MELGAVPTSRSGQHNAALPTAPATDCAGAVGEAVAELVEHKPTLLGKLCPKLRKKPPDVIDLRGWSRPRFANLDARTQRVEKRRFSPAVSSSLVYNLLPTNPSTLSGCVRRGETNRGRSERLIFYEHKDVCIVVKHRQSVAVRSLKARVKSAAKERKEKKDKEEATT